MSYAELVARGREIADAVYIAVPNDLHAEWIISCAEAGLHVLCEKPLTYEAARALNCRRVCRERGVLLAEGFMYRLAPCHARARELVTNGAIGRPHLIEATFTYSLNDPRNIRLQPARAGGALTDVGCYGIDLARFLLAEEPQGVVARGTFGEQSRVDELVSLMLLFPSGVVAAITASTRLPRYNAYRIRGEEGSLTAPTPVFPIESAAGELWLERIGQEPHIEHFALPNPFQDEITLFAAAVRERSSSVPFPLEDGVANSTVLEAARRSLCVGDDHALTALTAGMIGP